MARPGIGDLCAVRGTEPTEAFRKTGEKLLRERE